MVEAYEFQHMSLADVVGDEDQLLAMSNQIIQASQRLLAGNAFQFPLPQVEQSQTGYEMDSMIVGYLRSMMQNKVAVSWEQHFDLLRRMAMRIHRFAANTEYQWLNIRPSWLAGVDSLAVYKESCVQIARKALSNTLETTRLSLAQFVKEHLHTWTKHTPFLECVGTVHQARKKMFEIALLESARIDNVACDPSKWILVEWRGIRHDDPGIVQDALDKISLYTQEKVQIGCSRAVDMPFEHYDGSLLQEVNMNGAKVVIKFDSVEEMIRVAQIKPVRLSKDKVERASNLIAQTIEVMTLEQTHSPSPFMEEERVASPPLEGCLSKIVEFSSITRPSKKQLKWPFLVTRRFPVVVFSQDSSTFALVRQKTSWKNHCMVVPTCPEIKLHADGHFHDYLTNMGGQVRQWMLGLYRQTLPRMSPACLFDCLALDSQVHTRWRALYGLSKEQMMEGALSDFVARVDPVGE